MIFYIVYTYPSGERMKINKIKSENRLTIKLKGENIFTRILM